MRGMTLALSCLIACSGEKLDRVDTGTYVASLPPDGPGAFAVGTVASELVGRTGVTLEVQVWYPTQETGGEVHRYDGLYAGASQDGVPPDCTVTRPVMAFSHGNQAIRWQSSSWTERLASHGFVVVAPSHTGNTTFDYSDARLGELIFRRPLDVSDAVDWLFSDPELSELGLEPCLEPSAGFAMSGHSFGGYTTVAVSGSSFDPATGLTVCEEVGGWLCDALVTWIEENPDYASYDMTDARVWAMIPMAPAGYEVLGSGLSAVGVPALVLGGESDELTPMDTQVTPIYEGLGSSDKILGELWSAGHLAFSDACELVDFEECHPPYIDAQTAHTEINTVTVAFLRRVLGEDGMDAYLPNDADMWGWTTTD